jgi:hypothetical protein
MRFLLTAALLCAAGAQAAPIAAQGTWETTLQARDIDLDGTVDAYYDTTLNITWLADAGFALTSGYDTQSPPFALGAMTWNNATVWAQSLDVHGVTGWRLPAMFLPAGCTQTAFACSDAPGEMSHLFDLALGGAGNTGPFANLSLDGAYWAGPLVSYEDYTGPEHAFAFDFANGLRGDTDELGLSLYAWGVHDGDIANVPEPESFALMLAGLATVGMVSRRRRGA